MWVETTADARRAVLLTEFCTRESRVHHGPQQAKGASVHLVSRASKQLIDAARSGPLVPTQTRTARLRDCARHRRAARTLDGSTRRPCPAAGTTSVRAQATSELTTYELTSPPDRLEKSSSEAVRKVGPLRSLDQTGHSARGASRPRLRTARSGTTSLIASAADFA